MSRFDIAIGKKPELKKPKKGKMPKKNKVPKNKAKPNEDDMLIGVVDPRLRVIDSYDDFAAIHGINP